MVIYYGRKVVDYMFDGYDGEFNHVILITDDDMTHEEYFTNDEFDRLTKEVYK